MTIYILLKEDPWDEYYEHKPTGKYVSTLEDAVAWVKAGEYETTQHHNGIVTPIMTSNHSYMEVTPDEIPPSGSS